MTSPSGHPPGTECLAVPAAPEGLFVSGRISAMVPRRFSLLAASILLFCSASCIPLAYVYPRWTSIPGCSLPATETPVHVFRIEETTAFDRGGFICGWVSFATQRRITLVHPPDAQEWTGEQSLSLERGLVWWPIYSRSHSKTLAVKLYRPGYQTIEWTGNPKKPPDWHRATDIASQMAALDALWTPRGERAGPGPVTWTVDSAPALLFLASEYDRLAAELENQRGTKDPPRPDDRRLREELQTKARELRWQAGSIRETSR